MLCKYFSLHENGLFWSLHQSDKAILYEETSNIKTTCFLMDIHLLLHFVPCDAGIQSEIQSPLFFVSTCT